jgi:methoxymalonate biosynthesis acyl carrier protein
MRSEKVKSNQEIIRDYILENVDIAELDDGEDMFDSGLVNSLFAIQLMTFLEKEFTIKVTMDDLDMGNFKSVSSIHEFVRKKQVGEGKL